MKIQDVLRAGSVRRWGIVRTTVDQMLPEHMWNVTMIAVEIANRAGIEVTADLLMAAMTHDLDEVHTGDIPTTIKRRIPQLTTVAKMDTAGLDFTVHDIIKIADDIEAFWFINDYAADRHADKVREECFDKMMVRIESCSNYNIRKAANSVRHDLTIGEFSRE
jgi:HD superfamily phosphohydrolase YqeK